MFWLAPGPRPERFSSDQLRIDILRIHVTRIVLTSRQVGCVDLQSKSGTAEGLQPDRVANLVVRDRMNDPFHERNHVRGEAWIVS